MHANVNQGYALLIGVNDYSAYDQSQDNPRGKSDLVGSVNDVRAWWTLCNALGFRPENIRVLVSPTSQGVTVEGVPAAQVGAATEQAILEGVAWLAKQLGASDSAIGLLTYSGHGDYLEERGLVLCPTDVAGSALQHSIPYSELQRIIGSHGAAENLTVVLDTCHSGGATSPQRRALTLTGRRVPPALLQKTTEFAARVLAAAPRDGLAYQAEFAGRFHGAFTWALTSTLEQWKVVQQGEALRLTVSYGEALRRAQGLLTALSFSQTPGLHGVSNVATLAVFQSGSIPQRTSIEPDLAPTCMEIDPGERQYRLYTLTWQGSVIGSIIVPRIADRSHTFLPGTEYWFMKENVTPVTGPQTLTWAWTDFDWTTPPPDLGPVSFKMQQSQTWQKAATPPPSDSLFFVTNGPFSTVLQWGLTLDAIGWHGSLEWYSPVGQNTVFGGNRSVSSVDLTSNTTPVLSWYFAKVDFS